MRARSISLQPNGSILADGDIDQPLKRRYYETYRHITINRIGLQQHVVAIMTNREQVHVISISVSTALVFDFFHM